MRISSLRKKMLCHVTRDVKYLSENKSRKTAWIIRKMMEATVEAIGDEVISTISNVVSVSWGVLIFFIKKQRPFSQRRRQVENFVKRTSNVPGSATHSIWVNLIYEFYQLSIGISNVMITRSTRFFSQHWSLPHMLLTLYVFTCLKLSKSKILHQATCKRVFGLAKNATILSW